MRTLCFVLYSIAMACCGSPASGPSPDAAPDAPRADAARAADAVVVADAPERPDAGVLPLCSEACPGSELFADAPFGTYWWSYCLPSYQRCVDPSQCGSDCPPSD